MTEKLFFPVSQKPVNFGVVFLIQIMLCFSDESVEVRNCSRTCFCSADESKQNITGSSAQPSLALDCTPCAIQSPTETLQESRLYEVWTISFFDK